MFTKQSSDYIGKSSHLIIQHDGTGAEYFGVGEFEYSFFTDLFKQE